MRAGVLNRLAELEEKNQTENDGARFLLAVKDVGEWFEERKAAYNSPEAKAKREAEYQELQRIGELRKAAYDRGESMDAYPLPWERKGAEV